MLCCTWVYTYIHSELNGRSDSYMPLSPLQLPRVGLLRPAVEHRLHPRCHRSTDSTLRGSLPRHDPVPRHGLTEAPIQQQNRARHRPRTCSLHRLSPRPDYATHQADILRRGALFNLYYTLHSCLLVSIFFFFFFWILFRFFGQLEFRIFLFLRSLGNNV